MPQAVRLSGGDSPPGRRYARLQATATGEAAVHQRSLSALDRGALRLRAAFGRPARFCREPPLHGIGSVERGRQIAAGVLLFRGHVIDAPGLSIWDLPAPSAAVAADLHAFDWIEDLAATGDEAALDLARDWTGQWRRRFGDGTGPGWRAAVLGRRVRRWIDHAGWLMPEASAGSDALGRSLQLQAGLLCRRWRRAAPGTDRFDALTGAACAALALAGCRRALDGVLAGLADELGRTVAPDGGIAARDPEALSEIFAQIARIRADLLAVGRAAPEEIGTALASMAPVLRTLRHADGGLARFHGGGRGLPGRLDRAFAAAGVAPEPGRDRAMGFARLGHGRTSLILDAAPPPGGPAAATAHASTLAIELTSGRRPLIVGCGSGRSFGPRWRRAGRATPSHSTLTLDGVSSSRLAPGDGLRLDETPRDVRIERRRDGLSTGLVAGHDGYVALYGLTHVRQIFLGHDGRGVRGEDMLATIEREDEAVCDAALDRAGGRIPFALRFHLHPEVTARMREDGRSAELTLRSGESWLFEHGGAVALSIEPSVYLDEAASGPVSCQQVVLASSVADYATRVSWTLAKTPQTPDAVRDLVHDDQPVLV